MGESRAKNNCSPLAVFRAYCQMANHFPKWSATMANHILAPIIMPLLADTPLEYPRSFVLGGKKNLQGGKGKGIRGEKKKKEKKLGKKLKEKKEMLPTVWGFK